MKINVTIQKAHKLLESLKQLRNVVTSENIGFMRQSVSVVASEPYDKFVSDVKSSTIKIEANIQKELDILSTIGHLKAVIFKANVENGVNILIEDIATAQQTISLKQRVLSSSRAGYPSIDDITADFYNKTLNIEMEARNSNITFKIGVLKSEGLDVEIRELQKKVNEMTDRKVEINASHKVDLDIPDSLAEDLFL